MARTIKKNKDEQFQAINSVFKKMSASKELSDFSDELIEGIFHLQEPIFSYDWFTAWIIKMTYNSFGSSGLEKDIILMYFGILNGYHELKLSDRYDKFLFDSAYLEDGTKIANEYYLELKDNPDEYKNAKNRLSKKVKECIYKFIDDIRDEVIKYEYETFNGLEKYLDEQGEPIRCVLSNPAKHAYEPIEKRRIAYGIYSYYSLPHALRRRCTNWRTLIFRRVAMFVFLLAMALLAFFQPL